MIISDFGYQAIVTPVGPRTRMGYCAACAKGSVWNSRYFHSRARMSELFRRLWRGEKGQDVAEYALMLAVILAIAIGTIRLIGSHTGGVLANVGSAIR